MMDFISVPVVVGIVFYGVYKLFELFVCKNERLKIIDKLGDKFSANDISGKMTLPSYKRSDFSFSTLKGGFLMLGIGLGLLIGFFICTMSSRSYLSGNADWSAQQIFGIVYGACVLLFGGLGLLVAFIIEMKLSKKDRKEIEE